MSGFKMNITQTITELQMTEVPGAVFQIVLRIPTVIPVFCAGAFGATTARTTCGLRVATTIRPRFTAPTTVVGFPDGYDKIVIRVC